MNFGATCNHGAHQVEAEPVHDAEEIADCESRKWVALGRLDNPDADHRLPQSGAEARFQQPEVEKESRGIESFGEKQRSEGQLQFGSVNDPPAHEDPGILNGKHTEKEN